MERTMEQMATVNSRDALQAGFTARSATMDDLPAAMEISDLCDREVIGTSTGFSRHFKIFWTEPDCTLEKDVRVIESPTGEVVGFSHVQCEPPCVRARVIGYVRPDYRGRGLGTTLAEWTEARARQMTRNAPAGARTSLHKGVLSGDEHGAMLLRDQGMEISRHFVFMVVDFDDLPQAPVWPDGVELRPVSWEEHGRLICRAEVEIFRDHWGEVPKTDEQAFERFRHWIENDPEYDPNLWFVAWAGDEIAGMSLCFPKGEGDPEKGYVGILGVRRPWRGKGLGLALLRHSFCDFYSRGLRKVALHADAENITGALRLYTGAGMTIRRQYDNYEKELRPGKELAVSSSDDLAPYEDSDSEK